MRRFSKIFSGIAAIMLGVGIILVAFGIGSARSDWEKIVGAEQGSDQVEREFGGVKSIEVNIPFGYMEVAATKGDTVYFEAADVKADALKIREADGKLEIRMEGGKNTPSGIIVFPLFMDSKRSGSDKYAMQKYRLLLPENYGGNLKIEFGTGKLLVRGVDATEMDISIDIGDLVIEDCGAEKLNAGCRVGECSVDGIFRDVSVENDIGMLDVNIYGSYEDYDGVIVCGMGQMEYHMGVNYDEAVRYIRQETVPQAEEIGGEAAQRLPASVLSQTSVPQTDYAVCEEDEDYGEVVWQVEAWDRTGGVGMRKSWEGSTAKGKFKVKCGIGDVTVSFRTEGRTDILQQDEAEILGEWIPEETAAQAIEAAENTGTKMEMETRTSNTDTAVSETSDVPDKRFR